MKSRVLLGVVCITGSLACREPTAVLPYYRTSDMTPEWLDDATARSTSMHRVASFALRDQRAAEITAGSLRSKVSMVHFFFTKCSGVCPATQVHLASVLRSLPAAAPVQVLSHSVTPEADSLPVLAHYALEHGITDARWHLLTGDRATITRLARESYFVNVGNGQPYGITDLAHTESVLLVDGDGRLRGIYTGTLVLEMQKLEQDVRLLLAEQPRI